MRPFEDPPAAQREQRIAAEQRPALCKPVRDMPGRVSRHVPDLCLRIVEHERVAIGDLDIDHRNAIAVRLGADHGAAGLVLDFRHAADMVVVMMGGENMGQVPAEHVERFEHRFRVRRIHDRRIARRTLAQQVHVIIGPGGNLVNFKGRHLQCLRASGAVRSGNLSKTHRQRQPVRSMTGRGNSSPAGPPGAYCRHV